MGECDIVSHNLEIALEDVIRPGTKRGLDFVVLEELRKRTGIMPDEVLKFALAEMLCNSLDTDATIIGVNVKTEGDYVKLTVRDNGSKRLSLEDVKLILDFENKASSKRGFLRVSRGYLGNALKCIFGYCYALAKEKGLSAPEIVIESGSNRYAIVLKPDRLREVIDSEIVQSKRESADSAFIVKLPANPKVNSQLLKDVVFASSMVNPVRQINLTIENESCSFGSSERTEQIRQETSVLWYEEKQFESLFDDFLRARPDLKLSELLALFRGFTGKKVIKEILQKFNASNHDSGSGEAVQFFPATFLRDIPQKRVPDLFRILKQQSKAISTRSIASVLGCVGEKAFEQLHERQGWKRLRYVSIPAFKVECKNCDCPSWYGDAGACISLDHVKFPYLIELAVFDRQDHEGLKVYQCVNFMASMEDLFSRIFDIKYRLGRVGITETTSITVLVHLVCPVLKWLNYGKSGLDESSWSPLPSRRTETIRAIMEKAFDKLLPIPKTPRVYHLPPPPRPLTWIPHGNIGNIDYEQRLQGFASEVKQLNNQRTSRIKYTSRGWCYLLEGLGKIHKGEFTACQKAINDSRKLGFLPIDFVAEDQDETRHFKGIHIASEPHVQLSELKDDIETMLRDLPSRTTDYWTGEQFYVMMCVEKGDLVNLFKPICNQYHIPIVSSKGWAPILLRGHIANLSKKAETNKLTPVLLLFYDHDPVGLKISDTFRENLADCEGGTEWSPKGLIIERFGLNAEDIERYGLTWIGNLKTGSGRTSHDHQYIKAYGNRKCEGNALFKNDETLEAGQQICREAIEKYYGKDALERFRNKEEVSREKLKDVYANPVWKNVNESLDRLIEHLGSVDKAEEQPEEVALENETVVLVDNKYYGSCPKCCTQFNYTEKDYGRLVRCRDCHLLMRLAEGSKP